MDIKSKIAEIICRTHITPIEQAEQIDELYKQALKQQLIITDVVRRSEQLPCDKCDNGIIWDKDRLIGIICSCNNK